MEEDGEEDSAEEEESGSDEEEGSAYSKLMNSLRQDKGHQKILKKRRLEEEGGEDGDSEEEESDDEEEEEGEEGEEGESGEESEDGEELEWEEEEDDEERDAAAEAEEDEEEDDDEESGSRAGGAKRKRAGGKGGGESDDEDDEDDDEEGQEDDLEGDHAELLAEGDGQDSEDEDAPVPVKGKDKKEGGKDAFERHFQDATLDEAASAGGEQARAEGKWKRRETDGLPCGVLWRSGPLGPKEPPAALGEDEPLTGAGRLGSGRGAGISKQVAERFRETAKVTAARNAARATRADRDGAELLGGKPPARAEASGLTTLQRSLVPLLSEYVDVQLSNRTEAEAEQVREVLALHAVNHVTRSRETIQAHNMKLKKNKDKDVDVPAKDQGFTRCKVVVLLPCKNSAWRFIKTLLALTPSAQAPKGRVDSLRKLREGFGPGTKDERASDRKRLLAVGQDHFERFEGNTEDHFRVGIGMHSKYVRLFAPFYASDIIVASPLGLKMIVKSPGDKGRETDFLTSVEVVIIDQMDYLQMQNVEHLETVLAAMNHSPFKSRGADFTRLRDPYLDNLHKFTRQTVMVSAVATPEANAAMARLGFGLRGLVKTCEAHKGSIRKVLPTLHLRAMFHRILPDRASLEEVDQARFDYFKDKLYGRVKQTAQTHLLVVVPTYLEYVKLRALFNKEGASWVGCTEYSSIGDVARARSEFFHGRKEVLVITERFHFYHRFRLRGVHHMIFYAPPLFPWIYPELVNLLSLADDSGASVAVIYARQDALALARVAGSARASAMLSSDKPIHMFA